ncbi:hypothetical protein [uncultured Gilliamella sp.]|uniref:hypothetical protein n=1 Tax=uncultured Gilliamella sp. TaxID=1193505 RepID=UPI0025FBDD65|nr:hypothetical protein [uncultured Gilliamella sp.]
MSWYKEGSVNIEQGSKTVIGNDTKWTNPLIGVCAGQMLILKTAETIEIYEIASIQSDTQLTLANKYNGVTKAGVSYEIPTAPKVSIEALALRLSEMLNYYQKQMDGWQSILTGEGEVTLTAPDGRVVTIKSQYSIANELIEYVKASEKLAESSTKSAELANQSATSANSASSSAKNSESSAKISAETASKSAQAASQSAKEASNSAALAKISEINSKTSEANAAQSAIDAKNAKESIDTSNFIQKSGKENQSISGSLNINELTENGERVYSPNNKPSADDIGALAATKTMVNNVPIYMIGDQINFEKTPKVNGKSVITDISEIQSKLTELNNRAYITESYQNGDSWYQRFSNGFIMQGGTRKIGDVGALSGGGVTFNMITPFSTTFWTPQLEQISINQGWNYLTNCIPQIYNDRFVLYIYNNHPSLVALQPVFRWLACGY